MKIILLPAFFLLFCTIAPTLAQEHFEKDSFSTQGGELAITFIGHGSLMFAFDGSIIHVDPFAKLADYSLLPRADMVFLTHHHRDHLDPAALAQVRTDKTLVVLTEKCAETVTGNTIVMKNGETRIIENIRVEAVPAYNLVHKRENGQPYHPRGEGNGYILTFGQTRVYIAGDTENIPGMARLDNIDIAFLPMNLPYTMTQAMAADAAASLKPRVLYPYHYGDTDPLRLQNLLEDFPDIEVRIRSMR